MCLNKAIILYAKQLVINFYVWKFETRFIFDKRIIKRKKTGFFNTYNKKSKFKKASKIFFYK